MKLPFSFSLFGKKTKTEHFLTLLLKEEKATAVIFEEIEGRIKIIGEHEEYFSDFIDNLSIDELLEVLDKVISIAESSLSPNIETQKTIFGLKENWVQNSQIKKEYLAKLKKISETLGLIPIGFLIIHEAVTHFLQQKEGAPVSAILVEVGKKNLAISLIRAGRIIETKRTKIEDSIAKTTDRILHHFTAYEILPSRIILFNEEENEKLTQEFISHSWSKSLPFLHVPQITTLAKGLDANAMIAGVATQMGFEVLENDIDTKKDITIEEKAEIDDQKDNDEDNTKLATAETSTFVKTSADKQNEIETQNFSDSVTAASDAAAASFGFIKERDILENKPGKKELDKKTTSEFLKEEKLSVDIDFQEKDEVKSLPILRNIAMKIIHFFKNLPLKNISAIFAIFKNFKFPSLKFFKGNNKILFAPLMIVLFLILILVPYIFLLRATIVLNIKPKIIEQKQDIIFSLDTDKDVFENTIQAEPISVSEEGTLSTQTTGKKEIGEKAKGTVTIYNSSLSEGKTFPKGTTITSSNNLQFTLDDSVTIASASGDASSIISSTAKTSIAAKEIGKESNLPSGTKFTIGSLPTTTIIGKNETAFSGGSKKEITVVAKDDLDKLLKELSENLASKAKEDIIKKISSEKSLLPFLTKIATEKKSFDKEIGEEAKTVTLTGSFNYQSAVYKNSSLEKLTNSILENKYSQDLKISKNNVKNQIENIKEKNEKEFTATLDLKASLIPKLDLRKLTSALAGQTFNESKKTLGKLPQVETVEIKLQPNLPFLPKLLPRLSKNITINLEIND